ncbi:hypothetical protein SLEP1_g37988 [Rubroshorea leprosula]|uniref:RING-type E3 ubiquitin transferase n=3 Tax=Rubroshorea leprosula TaxID=152421 RepID=A0AAV5KWH7_9ROSI|nr:hypothetical protein SLEP1_g37988 [Rubroshorea leprosula]
MEEEHADAMQGDSAHHHRRLSIAATLSLPLTRCIRRLMEAGAGDGDSDSGYSYSKAVMVLDLIWNMSFVVVSVLVLLSAIRERPSTPLRAWLSGYAFQCVFHVAFVFLECRSKDRSDLAGEAGLSSPQNYISIVKRLESLNTILSSIWWVIGFYWIVMGGQLLPQESPRLYWLTVIFLAFDVFFIIFCLGMVCIIFFALFCFMPIVAIACAIATRQGASEDDIKQLPKYRYHNSSLMRTPNNYTEENCRTSLQLGSKSLDSEFILPPDDSECCICLSQYLEGAELHILPCNHHFHSQCVSKWLRINATCPLCKFNIQRGDTLV